jgi:hypothetical protein
VRDFNLVEHPVEIKVSLGNTIHVGGLTSGLVKSDCPGNYLLQTTIDRGVKRGKPGVTRIPWMQILLPCTQRELFEGPIVVGETVVCKKRANLNSIARCPSLLLR